MDLAERLLLYLAPAVVLATLDLAVKAWLPSDPALHHQRSAAWALLACAVLVLSFALALLPSRFVAFASGVLAAGVVGNLVSGALNHGRIPNPIVVASGHGGIAFNLADVAVILGIVLETAALVGVTIRYRHLLPEQTVAVRVARRFRKRE